MATTMQYPNESSTIDVLWSLLSQQTENVKRVLASRLSHSISAEKVVKQHTSSLSDEELAATLSGYPSLDECDCKEWTEEQYHQVVRSLSGKIPQSVSKWL